MPASDAPHLASSMPRPVGRKGLLGLPLAVEIALALTAKLLILLWLWHTFFSEPQAKHMHMPAAQVERQLLSPSQPSPMSPMSATPQEISHDSHR